MKIVTDKRALGVRVSRKLIKQLKRMAVDRELSMETIITPALEALVADFKASDSA